MATAPRTPISWDEYFMAIAELSAQRSKDPSTQVGSVIVDSMNRIVGIGYNGFPRGCSDSEFPWSKEGEDNKYLYVVHAEANAILNKNSSSIEGCKLFTTLFPCNECTKLILQCGIKEVIFKEDKYHDSISSQASRKMLKSAKVAIRQLNCTYSL